MMGKLLDGFIRYYGPEGPGIYRDQRRVARAGRTVDQAKRPLEQRTVSFKRRVQKAREAKARGGVQVDKGA
jgi:hypothetical protein